MSENSIYEETAYTEEEITDGSESEYEMNDDGILSADENDPFYHQKKALEEASAFLSSDHSNLFTANEQANSFIKRLSDALNYVGQYLDHGQYRKSYIRKLYAEIETGLQQVQEFKNANKQKICEEGLGRGSTVLEKVTAFFALNPEEEKKKDKRAFYEKCDNYSRLCDGLARDLEQVYKPFADDSNISAQFDHEIEALSDFSKRLEALIR